jgi:hypothetical protein
MRALHDKIWSVIEYIPHVGTVFFGAYVSFEASRESIAVDQMLHWILILLLFVATTQLMERSRSLRIMRSGIEKLPSTLSHNSILFRRDSREVDFVALAKSASTIDIVGWSCSWFFDAHDGFLESKIAAGCRIRMLLISEASDAAKVVMNNSVNDGALAADIRKAKAKAARLCEDLKDARGSFEMGEVNWLTPYGLVLIDANKPIGVASIGLHPLYLPMPLDSRRFILVGAATASSDFAYFRDQYEKLWKSGTIVCSTASRS